MFEAMTTYHREEINLFCANLFSGKNKHLYDVINSYTYMVTKIDIQQLNLSRDTFNESFQRICKKMFSMRALHDDGYIMALLVYTFKIEHFYERFPNPFYNRNILINSLTSVLEEIQFNPFIAPVVVVVTRQCILL